MTDTNYSGWALYQLQTQFENPDSSDEKRKEILKELQTRALEHTGTKCREGEGVFYAPWKEGLIPGHIYSPAGEREFGISGYCEYHFDEITKEPDYNEHIKYIRTQVDDCVIVEFLNGSRACSCGHERGVTPNFREGF